MPIRQHGRPSSACANRYTDGATLLCGNTCTRGGLSGDTASAVVRSVRCALRGAHGLRPGRGGRVGGGAPQGSDCAAVSVTSGSGERSGRGPRPLHSGAASGGPVHGGRGHRLPARSAGGGARGAEAGRRRSAYRARPRTSAGVGGGPGVRPRASGLLPAPWVRTGRPPGLRGAFPHRGEGCRCVDGAGSSPGPVRPGARHVRVCRRAEQARVLAGIAVQLGGAPAS